MKYKLNEIYFLFAILFTSINDKYIIISSTKVIFVPGWFTPSALRYLSASAGDTPRPPPPPRPGPWPRARPG